MSAEDERLTKLVHDLRTPLTVVSGFAELLVRRGADLGPEQRDEYLSRIVDGTKEMRDILDQERAARKG
jgi:K+-sensing histidine kinase KdpD